MTIGEAVRTHLLSSSTWNNETLGTQIAALVGTQIYPVNLPENVLKSPNDTSAAITIGKVSNIRPGHLRGQGSISRPRLQIDCWAKSKDKAIAVGNLVRRRLEGFSGTWTSDESPAQSMYAKVFFDTEEEIVEPEIHGGLGRHSADYLIWHSTAGGVL